MVLTSPVKLVVPLTIAWLDSDFIYDPDQDPEEKRAVRKDYRSLAKTVEGSSHYVSPRVSLLPTYCHLEQQANPNDYTAEELTDQVHQADKLFSKGIFLC